MNIFFPRADAHAGGVGMTTDPSWKRGVSLDWRDDYGPIGPRKPPMTPKATMDKFKPWFDYASCCLGLAAWAVACGVVGFNVWNDRIPALSWARPWTALGLVGAALYCIFLLVVLVRMAGLLIDFMLHKAVEWPYPAFWVVSRFLAYWLLLGLPTFVIFLIAHLALTALGATAP